LKEDRTAETGNETAASLDQALQTKYYVTKIANTETGSKYRLRKQFDKTTQHTLSAWNNTYRDMTECVL
jgi:hypothetical protein